MQVAGIIAEYNPFHNGHKYHLDAVRRQSNADYIIVVMSGDFTQRGAPALIHKYARAEMALSNGADLVLELPLYYACGSAEYFAGGAVALLDKLGVVNTLGFGSECGDIQQLLSLASFLNEETLPYQEALKKNLKAGKSYPLARQAALSAASSGEAALLSSPNNILGVEYCRALQKRGSLIHPITVTRIGSAYHESALGSIHSSALAIRNSLAEGADLSALRKHLPESVSHLLSREAGKTFPLFDHDFSALLHYKLILDSQKGYAQYVDVSQELSDRIQNHLHEFTSFQQFCSLIKTRDMTYTRVSRCLMHILLDLKKTTLAEAIDSDYVPYARILGFKKKSAALFTALKKNSSIPLLSKLSDASANLSAAEYRLLLADMQAAHIYHAAIANKFHTVMKPEPAQEIRIL